MRGRGLLRLVWPATALTTVSTAPPTPTTIARRIAAVTACKVPGRWIAALGGKVHPDGAPMQILVIWIIKKYIAMRKAGGGNECGR